MKASWACWYILVNKLEANKDAYTRKEVGEVHAVVIKSSLVINSVLFMCMPSLLCVSFAMVSCCLTSTVWCVVTKILLINCTLVRFMSAN